MPSPSEHPDLPRPIRVAVVNDYPLVVAGTAKVLEDYAGEVEVVELDSLAAPAGVDLDVVLCDTYGQADGPAPGAVAALQSSTTQDPAKVLIFSWTTDPATVTAWLTAGAAGYVSKSSSACELIEAIRGVHRGDRVRPGSTPGASRGAGPVSGRWPGEEAGLSARESEVLALICQGLSNEELARRSYIGINTVKTYIRSAYRKIDVTSRSQAVIWGLGHGFEPGPPGREHRRRQTRMVDGPRSGGAPPQAGTGRR